MIFQQDATGSCYIEKFERRVREKYKKVDKQTGTFSILKRNVAKIRFFVLALTSDQSSKSIKE